MMNKYNKNKAFTLIEVIVSITIFSIIIVSVI
ncbi:prepilin-type N-terminal cleavage/methylation domain-containing protein [bacterium]|nr:prepilin-type N-terminal cleavage/methylation domain-containing protein [bacterium]